MDSGGMDGLRVLAGDGFALESKEWMVGLLVCGAGLMYLVVMYLHVCVIPKLLPKNNVIPGPPVASYALGHVPLLEIGRAHYIMRDWVKQYGPCVQIWHAHRRCMILTDLTDVKYITVTKNYPKAQFFVEALKPIVPHSLITASAERHPPIRRAMNANFGRSLYVRLHECLQNQISSMVRAFDSAAEDGRVVELDSAMVELTFGVIFQMTISQSSAKYMNFLEHPLAQLVAQIMRESIELMSKPHLQLLGRFGAPKLYDAIRQVKRIALQVVKERRTENEADRLARNGEDLLDVLLKVPNETDDFIVSELIELFLAGTDTTAHTLAFCIFELTQNDSVRSRLLSEIHALKTTAVPMHTTAAPKAAGGVVNTQNIPSRSPTDSFTSNSFNYPSFDGVQTELEYGGMVWKETLRMRPVSATGTYRTLTEDAVLPATQVFLEKGTDVLLPPFAMHFDEEVWPNPYVFDPDRFSREKVRERGAFALQTFSSGSRNCVGQFFATHEGLTVLAVLLDRYEFTPVCDPSTVTQHHTITSRPISKLPDGSHYNGLPVRISKRNNS